MCQEKKEEEDLPTLKIPSIRCLEDDIKNSQEILITATGNETNNIMFNRTTITRKQKWGK